MTKSKRTRTGCLCCRRRHKKCDEQRPSCKFCESKGIKCEWPIKGSVFVTYKNDTPIIEKEIQVEKKEMKISSPKISNVNNINNSFNLNYNYNSFQLPIKKSSQSLPSLNQYHFIIPIKKNDKLSVNSLLN